MIHIVYVASPESQQIHVWQMDNQGSLTLLQVLNTPGQGKPMAIHPANTHLYIGVRPVCGVVSYYIDKLGLLTEANITPLPGSPTHLTTDSKGKKLYSVSYSSSCLSVSPIDEHGIVGAPQQTLEGLTNCHSANVDTINKLLWVPCLQEDRIRLYAIDESENLTTLKPVALKSTGAGPRHMAFHYSGNYAYVINELSGMVQVIAINAARTGPRIVQTLDMMHSSGLSDTRWAADIHITPNGNLLYCCDRTTSIISWFAVSEEGNVLSFLGQQKTETQPCGFNIDTQGRFLVAAGQKSHHIAVYAIDAKSGKLAPIARYEVGQGPMWVSIIKR
ncbi:6-phosphogluconolactonase [Candidatus Moranella endobia PCVAL]|uniref:6-phosphogluconolactonase n=1 Tax=Moranella endobia (strain PCIT) TaxID=903503 RepID=F7XXD8_MOREP|nr:6-phosphogluconolactonase [Candidatus Moranella endobia]AEI74764.1 putative 6-phosphogluconolactonase [Candidatus Moranella endobia PCIT]AGJ61421.1 6-phosphogluconolactonase [Candidatus Moranella endobia PCVAL]